MSTEQTTAGGQPAPDGGRDPDEAAAPMPQAQVDEGAAPAEGTPPTLTPAPDPGAAADEAAPVDPPPRS